MSLYKVSAKVAIFISLILLSLVLQRILKRLGQLSEKEYKQNLLRKGELVDLQRLTP